MPDNSKEITKEDLRIAEDAVKKSRDADAPETDTQKLLDALEKLRADFKAQQAAKPEAAKPAGTSVLDKIKQVAVGPSPSAESKASERSAGAGTRTITDVYNDPHLSDEQKVKEAEAIKKKNTSSVINQSGTNTVSGGYASIQSIYDDPNLSQSEKDKMVANWGKKK